jgi:lauroyl/myristoyl acyltransferase
MRPRVTNPTANPSAPQAFRGSRERIDERLRAPGDRRNWRRQLRRWLVHHFLVVPGIWFAERAPMWSVRLVVRRIGQPIAHTMFKRKSLENLERVFGDDLPPARRRALARDVTRNFLRGMDEWARIDDREAREKLRALDAESPRGAIGITGHIGNWEIMGRWTDQVWSRGVGGVMGRRMSDPRMNERVEQLRARLGLHTIYRDDPPTKPVRVLRDGQILAIVPDQDLKVAAGIFIEFLGHSAYTPVGPARLALTANVPMFCGFLLRQPDGSFKVEISDTIYPDRSRPRGEEIERLTRAWSAEIERVILAHPEQWAWFHERWKTTPEKLEARGRRRLGLSGGGETAG